MPRCSCPRTKRRHDVQARRRAARQRDASDGTPVVPSTVVGAGTALVGIFGQSATIYRRGGVSVEASNSHDNYFTYNLIAIRAESRQALAVFRPGAFTSVSGLA